MNNNNNNKLLQNLQSRHACDSQGFLKTCKRWYSDFHETPPWWVPDWVKFGIFSSLERYGTSETNLPKFFTVVESVMRSPITSNS